MHTSTDEPRAQEPSEAAVLGSPRRTSERIVVGADGSAPSIRAVAWAATEAAHRGAQLLIVVAWQLPSIGLEAYEYAPIDPSIEEAAIEQAGRWAADAVGKARQILPPDQVDSKVLCGKAAEVLIEQSKDADLLVVGSRGRGGFRGLLLGSVSQQCTSHASCPVVVVRNGSEPSTARAAG